jgi:hypothetical protein
MSVAATTQAVVDRTKTETRRLGWTWLLPGVDLDLCRKVQGRRHSDGTVEPLERLARVHVWQVGRERLDSITQESVDAEGVPGVTTPADFVAFYCAAFDCTPDTMVTVIRWEYVDPPVWTP